MKSSLPRDSRSVSEPLPSTSGAPSRNLPGSFSSPWAFRVLLAIFVLFQIGIGLAGPNTDVEHYRLAAARLLETGSPYGVKGFGFLYPPALAVAFIASVPFSARAVTIAWVLISASVLAIAVARVARGRAWIVLLALVYTPFAATQWDAQVNALVLLAIAAARPLLLDREVAGGLALGASLAVKPFALPATMALAARGRVRAAGVAMGVALASFLLVLPFGGSPTKAAARYGHILTKPMARFGPPVVGTEISLTGTLDRLLGPDGTILRRTLLKGVPLVILAVAMLRKLSPVETFDAVLAGTLLGARFSWLHHATILFPAVVSLGSGTASVVAALFVIATAKRYLGTGATVCGTIALGLIAIAPLVLGPRREAHAKGSSGS